MDKFNIILQLIITVKYVCNELNITELINLFELKKIRVSQTAFIIFSSFILSLFNYIKNSEYLLLLNFNIVKYFY